MFNPHVVAIENRIFASTFSLLYQEENSPPNYVALGLVNDCDLVCMPTPSV